jgi:hypothetical protein
MADKIESLADRKRELITRSEIYRQSLEANLSDIKEATAWIPRTFRLLRSVYPLALLVLPLLGFAVRRKAWLRKPPPPPKKKGLLSKAAVGIKVLRTVKPFWDGFRQAQRAHNVSSKRRF